MGSRVGASCDWGQGRRRLQLTPGKVKYCQFRRAGRIAAVRVAPGWGVSAGPDGLTREQVDDVYDELGWLISENEQQAASRPSP